MELFLFLNFSPTRQWLDFWAHWSATKSFAQKIPIFQQNLKNDHAPQNLRRDHAPSKIWEATMLHQKINMIVFLQTDFSNYGGTLFLGSKICHEWKYSFSWMTMLQKNLRIDHAPIWEATMLHQKINMTVPLQNVTNGAWSFFKLWWNPFLRF